MPIMSKCLQTSMPRKHGSRKTTRKGVAFVCPYRRRRRMNRIGRRTIMCVLLIWCFGICSANNLEDVGRPLGAGRLRP